MNEDPRNPIRWYKLRDRNDKGSVLGWIFLVILIAIVIIIVLVSPEGGCFDCDGGLVYSAYNTAKDEIQNAVTAYQTDHNKLIPTLSGIYTNANCSNCNVINISALVVANGGILREAPDGLNLSASGNDNCGGDADLGCSNGSSYIWIVNTYGVAFTYCAGAGCTTNNSGYQDVWP